MKFLYLSIENSYYIIFTSKTKYWVLINYNLLAVLELDIFIVNKQFLEIIEPISSQAYLIIGKLKHLFYWNDIVFYE